MNSGIPFQLGGRRHVLPLLFLIMLAMALPAIADRLELAQELEGWECAKPNTMAGSADGVDFYVAGSGPNFFPTCLGLAWFRRDPFSGRLELMKVWGQRDLGIGGVGGPALSHDGRHLYVGVHDSLLIFERGLDGDLRKIGEMPSHSLDLIGVSPDDGEVWALGFGIEIFARSASGLLTFKQRLALGFDSPKPAFAFIDASYAYAGERFLRRVGGMWSAVDFVREDSPYSAVTDASGNYLYISGRYSGFPYITTYDVSQGNATPVSHLRIADTTDDFAASLERDPRSGDIYAVSGVDSGAGRYFTEILRFTTSSGGRVLTPAGSWVESLGYSRSQFLKFAADGRHLYSTFENEPVALFRIPPSGLAYVPGGADPASRLRLPTFTVPAGNGDLYVSVHAAIQLLRKNGARLEVVDDYGFSNWPNIGNEARFALALTPDGRRAAVISASSADFQVRLALADRDAASGELRLRPETSLLLGGGPMPTLEISPDGKFLYLSRESRVDIFALQASPPRLVPVETPGRRGQVAIAPSGRDALVGRDYFLRDPATGLLTPAAEPAPGWERVNRVVYSRGGQLLVALADRDFAARLMVLERSGAGWRLLGEQALPDAFYYSELLVDPHGRRLFLDVIRRGNPSEKALQLWEWDGGTSPFRFSAELDALALNDGDISWPRYGLSQDGNDLYATSIFNSLLRVFRAKCEPGSAYSACLGEGRFRVEIDWRDAAGAAHPALPTRIGSDDSRLFTFFDADNWEVLTKVLDGCGINQRVWVYSAATTDVGNQLRVTDTWSGQTAVYDNPAGTPAAAITDGDALDVCAVPSPGWVPVADNLPPVFPAGELLEVQNGRFEVSATWVTAAGQRGNATALSARTAAAGLFYFFSPENWEIQAKVLDGCAINGRYWFFAAATTDVGYTLSVRDRQTGRIKTYQNPVGRAAPAITDIDAFACP